MNKFRVGDLIKGTELGSTRYSITDQFMHLAKVISVVDTYKDTYIEIEILNHDIVKFIGKKYKVDPKYFEYSQNFIMNKVVKIIKAPYGAKGMDGHFGIIVDKYTVKNLDTENFAYQGLSKEESTYYFIPFYTFYNYKNQENSGEIWGFGNKFEDIIFEDVISKTTFNEVKKEMTIEEIEKKLGYKIKIKENN